MKVFNIENKIAETVMSNKIIKPIEIARELGVTRKDVVKTISNMDVREVMERILPHNEVLEAFKQDFEMRPWDRDKLFEIWMKMIGLDRPAPVNIDINTENSEIKMMQQLLGGSFIEQTGEQDTNSEEEEQNE